MIVLYVGQKAAHTGTQMRMILKLLYSGAHTVSEKKVCATMGALL